MNKPGNSVPRGFIERLTEESAAASFHNRATWIAREVRDWLLDGSLAQLWQADEDAPPSKYKTYPDAARLALDAFGPLRFSGTLQRPLADYASLPDLPERLGHLLAMSAAPATFRARFPLPGVHDALGVESDVTSEEVAFAEHFSRGIPSGGGLYPWELYVYWRRATGLPRGLYHYDAARHCLSSLPCENGDERLRDVLAGCEDLGGSDAFLFATTVYRKTCCKYGDYGVHLLALDTGVLVAQLAYLAPAMRLRARCIYQFRDLPLCEALGISLDEEAPHAIVGLWDEDGAARSPSSPTHTPRTSSRPRPALPNGPAHRRWALARLMNRASVLAEPPSTCPPEPAKPSRWPGDPAEAIPLAPAAGKPCAPLAATLRCRRSGIDATHAATIDPSTLRDILSFTAAPLCADVCTPQGIDRCTSLLAVVNRVTGLEPGVYRYEQNGTCLLPIHRRPLLEQAAALQEAYGQNNISFYCAATIVFVVGDLHRALATYGNRGLRLLDHAAGWAVHRCGLAAGATGHGFHAIFGMRDRRSAALLGLSLDAHSLLIAMAIGGQPAAGELLNLPLWSWPLWS